MTIKLSGGPHAIELLIADNGTGFNVVEHKKGLGLTSMQERVRPLRGQIGVTSEPGQGTRLAVKIPVPADR